MLKYPIAFFAVIALLVGGFFWFNAYIYDEKQGGEEDYKKITVAIDGRPIAIGTEGTRFFGNEAKGDLNNDGIVDLAFLITHDGGGSGTFYYVVAALQNNANRYIGTNAVFLGDRIAPQSTEISGGILIVNYADRRSKEPFSAQPSVGTSAYFKIEGGQLVPVSAE